VKLSWVLNLKIPERWFLVGVEKEPTVKSDLTVKADSTTITTQSCSYTAKLPLKPGITEQKPEQKRGVTSDTKAEEKQHHHWNIHTCPRDAQMSTQASHCFLYYVSQPQRVGLRKDIKIKPQTLSRNNNSHETLWKMMGICRYLSTSEGSLCFEQTRGCVLGEYYPNLMICNDRKDECGEHWQQWIIWQQRKWSMTAI
jgi:hypothetical protein